MDNLTHSLTGLMLSRAGLQQWCPQATALLVVASNIPDADTVSLLLGPLGYLEYHRHLTHALVAIPVLGLAVAALVRFALRLWPKAERFPLGRGVAVASLGVTAHIVMDLFNNYGVRLALPFSGKWYQWDTVMVVDGWLLLGLGLAVGAPLFSRLVSSEVASRKVAVAGRGWAIAALLFLGCWVGSRAFFHEQALAGLRSFEYMQEEPERVAAWPTPWNPFRWTGYVSTASAWHLVEVNLLRGPDPEAATSYYKPRDPKPVNAAKRTATVQSFLRFAQYPVWRMVPVSEPEGGVRLLGNDVRFGNPEEGRFQVEVVLDAQSRVVSESYTMGPFGISTR